MSALQSHNLKERASAVIPPKVLERILLTKVSDLDSLFEDPEVRAAVAGFSPSYLLVALPKSSSTYCTQALARILGATVYKDIVTQDRFSPKDLNISGIVNSRDRLTLSQVHLTATGANLRILRHFRVPMVILLRNLFDAVVSMRDHMNKNPFFSSILIPNDYRQLSEVDKLDYIIDTAVPWMITFYVSWVQAISRGDVETEFFSYEDMVGDPVPFFQKMCAHFGKIASAADIENAIAQVEKSAATRFNVGKSGRGLVELSPAQIARIAAMRITIRESISLGSDFESALARFKIKIGRPDIGGRGRKGAACTVSA